MLHLAIQSGGRPLDPAIEIRGVVVRDGIDRVPAATLTIVDGAVPHGFRIGDRPELAPGAQITVRAGSRESLDVLFQGAVTGRSIEADAVEAGVLRVSCEHAARSLRAGRSREARSGESPTEVLSNLIAKAGLASALDAAHGTHVLPAARPGESDWDHLLAVARANDLAVVVRGRSIAVVPRRGAGPAVTRLTYGEDVIALRLASTPDPGTEEVHRRGTVTFPGDARVRPGTIVELPGVGPGWDGPALVSAVRHDIADGDWVTEAAVLGADSL